MNNYNNMVWWHCHRVDFLRNSTTTDRGAFIWINQNQWIMVFCDPIWYAHQAQSQTKISQTSVLYVYSKFTRKPYITIIWITMVEHVRSVYLNPIHLIDVAPGTRVDSVETYVPRINTRRRSNAFYSKFRRPWRLHVFLLVTLKGCRCWRLICIQRVH